MNRETYYDIEPRKYFQGEDLPVKSKKATHLVTYPNFLTCDGDHSQDRPFTNSSPETKKRSFKQNQFYSEKDHIPPYREFKSSPKKINIKEGHHMLSTTNPLKFDPTEKLAQEKAEIKRTSERNRSSLSGSTAQPTQVEPYRSSKRVHSGKYTDSSSMKLSLAHGNA